MAISGRVRWVSAGLAGAAAIVSIGIGFTGLADQLNNDVYDFLFRLHPARTVPAESAILAIDEETYQATQRFRNVRRVLADVWPHLLECQPELIAVDLTLTDMGDEAEDKALETQFAKTPNLILGAELMPDGKSWQMPLPRFAKYAAGIGHFHALPEEHDSVTRHIMLEEVAGMQHFWALSLEAYRIRSGAGVIESSPTDLTVGNRMMRSRQDARRPMRIRFRPSPDIPRVSLIALSNNLAAGTVLKGRAVFVGVTALSAAPDRLFTPISSQTPIAGVEIHAQSFETIRNGDFLEEAPGWWALALALGFALLAFAVFHWLPGSWAYAAAAALVLFAHYLPDLLFRHGTVLPPFTPVTSAWLSTLACFSWQFFFVRRRLRESEAGRARYQQAIRFVTHEMRTPLTAIQGSSEMITRYKLTDEKRQQLGSMINSESKRLAQMITTFLNVEKLTAGQLELKNDVVPVGELVGTCVERARPLAEKKNIRLEADSSGDADLHGDRELLEYAVYNLLTNAIKYSPQNTEIHLHVSKRNRRMTLSVQDQGIGMNENEVKRLFTKFYRTESAEKSGEVGTGLGLSIVEQIVTNHGGSIQVASSPGKGSCFTIELPASDPATAKKD